MFICTVVVVYGQRYNTTRTYKSLVEVAEKLPNTLFDVVIYDNSPEPQLIKKDTKFHNIVYKHDPRNIGVVPAYQFGRDYCRLNNIKWLLRLDQDSLINVDMITEFLDIEPRNNVKAFVPKVICRDKVVSPSYVHIGGFYTPISRNIYGIINRKLTFINSMSFIDVSDDEVSKILDSLKCYLDLSDHEFAYKLSPSSVYLMKTNVYHSLSIKEDGYVSFDRYMKILYNEVGFIKRTEGCLGRIVFKIRLLLRSMKFLLKGRKEHAILSLKKII